MPPISSVTVTFKLDGDFSSIEDVQEEQSNIALEISAKLGVPASKIRVTLVPGSIIVIVTILQDVSNEVSDEDLSNSLVLLVQNTSHSFENDLLQQIDYEYEPLVVTTNSDSDSSGEIDNTASEKNTLDGALIFLIVFGATVSVVGLLWASLWRKKIQMDMPIHSTSTSKVEKMRATPSGSLHSTPDATPDTTPDASPNPSPYRPPRRLQSVLNDNVEPASTTNSLLKIPERNYGRRTNLVIANQPTKDLEVGMLTPQPEAHQEEEQEETENVYLPGGAAIV